MTTAKDGLAIWHDYIANSHGSPEALAKILHEDCVFHSPVVHTPQRGKAMVMAYLTAAGGTLGQSSFNYVREMVDGPHVLLEFTAEMDGIHVNGIDLMTFDENGLITDFKVMVRPLKAVNKVWEQMGAALEKMKAG